jgi:ribosomal protein S18 acetylase RimI-like enzyme
MKRCLVTYMFIMCAIYCYGSQPKIQIKPEEAVLRSKIVEYRIDGVVCRTMFYLLKDPQLGEAATTDDIIAYIELNPQHYHPLAKKRVFYLEWLHVNPEFRNRLGYGGLLFDLMVYYLRNYSVHELFWLARPHNLRPGESQEKMLNNLIRFYEKKGGKVIKRRLTEAEMMLDVAALGVLKQPWLPENLKVLPNNIPIIELPLSGEGMDTAEQKALTSEASFVIINEAPLQQAKEYIKSKL